MPAETDTTETGAAEADDASRRDEQNEKRSDAQPSKGGGDVLSAVLKGAALGSAAGAAIGAWAAFARVMWPEQIDAARDAAVGTVRDVGRTAASAAAQTVDPAAVLDLLPAKGGNDDRAEVVKRAARDAAAAAARAAREAITSLSENGNGTGGKGSRKRGEEGD